MSSFKSIFPPLLFAENSECTGMPKQMTLEDYAIAMGFTPFKEEFVNDFNEITHGLICREDGYRHYIIGYSKQRNQIQEIRLLYLDKDFDEVDELQRQPLRLRPGVKLALRVEEEEA